jgi:hypothetical protein
LERVADVSLIEGILKGLDDPCVRVRFSLVGAVGRAAGDGQSLPADLRKRLLARLEGLLRRDSDPGVRSRAATVMGEFAAPALLDTLWRSVQAGAEGRVQVKAWDAFVEIIARSGSLPLLQQWDKTLAEAKQAGRRLQLLAAVVARWRQRPDTREAGDQAQGMLVRLYLDQSKWAAAAPLVRELLARGEEESESAERLGWLLSVGELALKEGNRPEALRAAQEGLTPARRVNAKLADSFAKLATAAEAKE